MIETERLRLRSWRMSDLTDVLAVTNTGPVMEFMGGVRDEAHFRDMIERQIAYEQDHGFCFWPVMRKEDGAFLGLCGLKRGTVPAILDEMEVGWRFGEDYWGKGYAREAAEAVLAFVWKNIACDTVFAITAVGNAKSRLLMERLAMSRRGDLDFHHPTFAPDHPLGPHVTYAIGRPGAIRRPGLNWP